MLLRVASPGRVVENGTHEADCAQVDRWTGSTEAADAQGAGTYVDLALVFFFGLDVHCVFG